MKCAVGSPIEDQGLQNHWQPVSPMLVVNLSLFTLDGRGFIKPAFSSTGGEPSIQTSQTMAHDIGEELGMSKPRLDKDLNLYTSTWKDGPGR